LLSKSNNITRKYLLGCGILSMLWYVTINIIVPMYYPGYDSSSKTVSELSAIDAPTRTLWVVLCIFYSILFMAFGAGIWISAKRNRNLRIVAAVILFDALLGFFWPPMHQREVIAAGGGTLTDTFHLAWAFIHLILMLLMIGFGATAMGKDFKVFSIGIVLVFVLFGMLTVRESSGIKAGLPTPHLGTWERVNIGAYMLWVVIFTILLMQRNNKPA
jgi:hypothetical protein